VKVLRSEISGIIGAALALVGSLELLERPLKLPRSACFLRQTLARCPCFSQ